MSFFSSCEFAALSGLCTSIKRRHRGECQEYLTLFFLVYNETHVQIQRNNSSFALKHQQEEIQVSLQNYSSVCLERLTMM